MIYRVKEKYWTNLNW